LKWGSALALGACALLTSRQLPYWQNSVTLFEHALAVTPDNGTAHLVLGAGLYAQGQYERAMAEYRTAAALDPAAQSYAHLHLAEVLQHLGRSSEAVSHLREAVRLDPDLTPALNNLAWVLASSDDAEIRNGAEAVRLAEHACELTKYRATLLVGTLAAAYAEEGRFGEAVATAQKACALASKAKDQALLRKNQELLELYRAGQAYHEATRPAPAGRNRPRIEPAGT
jgi:tetratricopeptide (TPR) repeat protein